MKKVVLIYSTTDNYTYKISQAIKETMEKLEHSVELISIDDNVSLDDYDKIIIGASIRYGKHNKTVYKFIEQNQTMLESKPSAFFSVNIVARKPLKNTPQTNPYLLKFLKQIDWKPENLAVFAGKLDYQRYGLFDRYMIRFIMWLTKGSTDLHKVIEFTNWDDVKSFSKTMVEI